MPPSLELYLGLGFAVLGTAYYYIANRSGGGDVEAVEVSSNALRFGPAFGLSLLGVIFLAAYFSGIDLLATLGLSV